MLVCTRYENLVYALMIFARCSPQTFPTRGSSLRLSRTMIRSTLRFIGPRWSCHCCAHTRTSSSVLMSQNTVAMMTSFVLSWRKSMVCEGMCPFAPSPWCIHAFPHNRNRPNPPRLVERALTKPLNFGDHCVRLLRRKCADGTAKLRERTLDIVRSQGIRAD